MERSNREEAVIPVAPIIMMMLIAIVILNMILNAF